MQEILTEVNAHGFFPEEIIPDGKLRRFKRTPQDKHKDAWCMTFENFTKDGKKFYFYLGGDWREPGLEIKVSTLKKMSLEDRQAVDEKIEQARRIIEENKKLIQENCVKECEQIWADALGFEPTEYTVRKKIEGSFGLKTKVGTYGIKTLLVPVKTIDNKLVGLQKIFPDGKKFFHPGTAKKGAFHLIGDYINGEALICEGFATGASLHMATKKPVIVAFDAGNLVPVAKGIRRAHPDTKLIICGDDDRGTDSNPGRKFAELAAKESSGIAVFPSFTGDANGCTDFNDLHVNEGIESVQKHFHSITIPITKETAEPKKKAKKIFEGWVVKKLLDEADGNIVKSNEDLFAYKDGVWKHLDQNYISSLKGKILDMFGDEARSRDAESAFKSFMFKIPSSPVDMFKPNPYCSNYLNGTLHIFKNESQDWLYEFRPHSREDYLINQLPYEYNAHNKEQNTEFLKMLDRIFSNDEDKDEKIRAIKQMYGACLIPAFPHLFMLHGKAGSGKTSVIMPLYEFLKAENISSVEPYQFSGFQMESMAGKLVNIVTDIDTQKPIEDSNIKKIEDRVPVKIDRKFKSIVTAPLPAIHIFGGNDIPPTLEGGSRAHVRRWTFIEFKSFQASGNYDKSFSQWVFNQSPIGILNFALEGLADLLANRGHFINPRSGKARIEQWMEASDIVALFLNDIESREVRDASENVIVHTKADADKINRVEFFAIFLKWFEEAGHDRYKKSISRNLFYQSIESKGIFSKRETGGRFVVGFFKDASHKVTSQQVSSASPNVLSFEEMYRKHIHGKSIQEGP